MPSNPAPPHRLRWSQQSLIGPRFIRIVARLDLQGDVETSQWCLEVQDNLDFDIRSQVIALGRPRDLALDELVAELTVEHDRQLARLSPF